MNIQNTSLSDFFSNLSFVSLPLDHGKKAIALVTQMPAYIPLGDNVLSIWDSDNQVHLIFDVHPVPNVPGWFFITKHLLSPSHG